MEKLKLNDFMNYHFLSQLKYSPDGGASAIVATKANDKNGYFSALYVKNGGDFIRLTSPYGKVGNFIWMDNETILFSEVRCPDKKKALEKGEELTSYNKINIHGGEGEELFTMDLKVSEINALGDGQYLLYAVHNNNYPELAGKAPHEKAKLLEEMQKQNKNYQVIDEAPFWFNGLGFTNKLRNRLYLYSPEKGAVAVTDPLCKVESYRLTPCKKYVVYIGQSFDSLASLRNSMYIYSIETGETKQLLGDDYFLGQMDIWESTVIFTAGRGDKHGNNQNKDFYTIDLKSGEMKLLKEYPLSICTPVNSDNRLTAGIVYKVHGNALYFTGLDRFYTDLFKMALPSGEIEKVYESKGSVDFFDVCDAGIQLVALKDHRLQEVYQVSDGKSAKISTFNEDIYQNKIYQKPEYHVFTNPHGTEIDGWALLPVGYEAGKKYPAILNIHGGPKTAFGDIYFHEMQYWAAEGYFVIFCNPTGGDGRGDAFADIRGKYGTVDYDDLMQFTDEMLKKYPDIDPNRLGVTGGSYGGFMTNWIIGHTDRFKAAASQRSISNWVSFTYVCDIGYTFGVDQMQANAWDNVDKMWEQSPLKYANNAKTPTLFIHSDQDYRCWVPEAMQMFTALKLHNVDTRMCLFHGENHELSRSGKPDNRVQRLTEITNWMDKYLK